MTTTIGSENLNLDHNHNDSRPYDHFEGSESHVPLDGAVVDPETALNNLKTATEAFRHAVDTIEPVEPVDKQTKISWVSVDREVYGDDTWRPANVYKYSSEDPYQEANPELTAATNAWIDASMAATRNLKQYDSTDPELAYVNGKRANGGRHMTQATRIIAGVDEGVAYWIKSLPRSENLGPVANPWGATKVVDKDLGVIEIPSSRALQALTGGSCDGRAVRERGAWETRVVEAIDPSTLENEELVITSLGTGTGEPAADSGIGLARRYSAQGGRLRVIVNGADIKKDSLAVATHIAEEKAQALNDGTELKFVPHLVALHRAEELAAVVKGTRAKVYEAIGLAEYMASENATDPAEQKILELMRRVGGISAEEFYSIVYENMPEGSIFITGNMTSDSPQGDFVEDGLGWPSIIRRSDEEFLDIMRNAGIPGEAVDLYVPDKENSAASYNLVVLHKPYSKGSVHELAAKNWRAQIAGLGRHALEAA